MSRHRETFNQLMKLIKKYDDSRCYGLKKRSQVLSTGEELPNMTVIFPWAKISFSYRQYPGKPPILDKVSLPFLRDQGYLAWCNGLAFVDFFESGSVQKFVHSGKLAVQEWTFTKTGALESLLTFWRGEPSRHEMHCFSEKGSPILSSFVSANGIYRIGDVNKSRICYDRIVHSFDPATGRCISAAGQSEHNDGSTFFSISEQTLIEITPKHVKAPECPLKTPDFLKDFPKKGFPYEPTVIFSSHSPSYEEQIADFQEWIFRGPAGMRNYLLTGRASRLLSPPMNG